MKTETHPSPKQESMASISALRVLARAENLLMAFLVVAIFGVVLAAILSRFVFHVSLSWTTEVSVTLMIWMTFLGIAMGVRDRVHVAFELFEDKLTGRWLVAASFIQMLLMAFLLVSLAWGGWEFTRLGLDQLTPSGIPQWISFAAIPVGSALGLLHLAVCAADLARGADLDARASHGHGTYEAGA